MAFFFVIPAYQADSTIFQVVSELFEASKELGDVSVLVVDDGSLDATRQRAIKAGAKVLTHPRNRGKGAALGTGLRAAGQMGARCVVTLDADGQHAASDAVRLARHEASDGALLLGVRSLKQAGAPRSNQFGNGTSNLFVSWFSGRRFSDTQCGLRRYPVGICDELKLRSTGFAFEAEAVMRAARAGLSIIEVPVGVAYPPPSGTSHFRLARDPAAIVYRVVHTAVTAWY